MSEQTGMSKMITLLVEQTFNGSQNNSSKSWNLIYLSSLKSYWLKEKNWFFPEYIFQNISNQTGQVEEKYQFTYLFDTHSSSKFFVKKNEEDSSLVLYYKVSDLEKVA